MFALSTSGWRVRSERRQEASVEELIEGATESAQDAGSTHASASHRQAGREDDAAQGFGKVQAAPSVADARQAARAWGSCEISGSVLGCPALSGSRLGEPLLSEAVFSERVLGEAEPSVAACPSTTQR